MKKLAYLSLCFIVFLAFTSTGSAQSVRFGVNAGLTNITGPSDYTNSVADGGAGFGASFNFGAQARLNLPLVPLTPIIFVDYHMLRGSGTNAGYSVSTSQNIFSVGAEAEYNVLPLPLIKPYVSLGVAYNNMGEYKVDAGNSSLTQSSVNRYGGAIGIGSVFTILPVIDLDVSLKYRIFNLIGKSSGESNIGAVMLDAAIIF